MRVTLLRTASEVTLQLPASQQMATWPHAILSLSLRAVLLQDVVHSIDNTWDELLLPLRQTVTSFVIANS